MNTAPLFSSTEANVLSLQKQLLQVNSIMLHHDAITGTHPSKVGEDYTKMMQDAEIMALKGDFQNDLGTILL